MSKFDPYEYIDIKLNPDGSITRLLNFPTSTPNPDGPFSGDTVLSKDYIVSAENNTSLRVYLPTKPLTTNPAARLPIMLYFHGCQWIKFRANNPALHRDREKTATVLSAIILLIDYRLAPEHRLPAQYEDALTALIWLRKQAVEPDGDQWLKDYGDFSRTFLCGSGNGGNMVFHAALRAVDLHLDPVKLEGIIMNQPMFGGQSRTKSEIKFATDQITPLPVQDLLWELGLPKGVDRDHRYSNPLTLGENDKEKLRRLPRCLVIGFGMDPLIDRQQDFVRLLARYGVKVDAHFEDAGFHRIELVDPRRNAGLLTMFKIFINSIGSDQQPQTSSH